jgi:hypothetical protein
LHGIGTQAAPVFADICGSKIVDEIKSVGGWNKQKGQGQGVKFMILHEQGARQKKLKILAS